MRASGAAMVSPMECWESPTPHYVAGHGFRRLEPFQAPEYKDVLQRLGPGNAVPTKNRHRFPEVDNPLEDPAMAICPR